MFMIEDKQLALAGILVYSWSLQMNGVQLVCRSSYDTAKQFRLLLSF